MSFKSNYSGQPNVDARNSISAPSLLNINRHTACSKVTAFAVSKATWEKKKICEGYFFFVAIDSMMRPIPIPQFVVENDDEQIEWDNAKRIRSNMVEPK